jgi:DNA-binding MarR family transcriptional regulator
MPSHPAGTIADQIIDELRPVLTHQRHKWAAACQASGLSMTHFQVLTILDADGPTAMSRLAEALGASFSNVTGIVGRLEERGWVTRVHDDADRRIVLAQLTDDGSATLRGVEEVRLGHLRQLIETMSPDEQRTVLSAVTLMTAARQRFVDDHPDLEPDRHHKEPRSA